MLGDQCSCTELEFLGKFLFGQKRPQNEVFSLFWKITSLIFAGNLQEIDIV